ncbi:MAG: lipocalin-like domain-containing protein [Paraprevotella sp.]|nr:lipocalin-like domain-containing protein [Paraprevotella sp.]
MKKTSNTLLSTLAIFILIVTNACDKLPKNGDLEGNWQLAEMTSADSDNQPITEDVKHKKIFWVFQQDLLCIRYYNKAYFPFDANKEVHEQPQDYSEFFGRFNHQSNTLDIPQLYVHDTRSTDKPLNTNSRLLKESGIIGNRETFRIEVLNKEQLILSSDKVRLVFRNF